jgi:hypothetical protein
VTRFEVNKNIQPYIHETFWFSREASDHLARSALRWRRRSRQRSTAKQAPSVVLGSNRNELPVRATILVKLGQATPRGYYVPHPTMELTKGPDGVSLSVQKLLALNTVKVMHESTPFCTGLRFLNCPIVLIRHDLRSQGCTAALQRLQFETSTYLPSMAPPTMATGRSRSRLCAQIALCHFTNVQADRSRPFLT